MAKKQYKPTKQQLAERLWLIYFNDTLFAKGLITDKEHSRMKLRILSR